MATSTIKCSETVWIWDKDNKSSAIEISDGNLSVTRPSSSGKNPAVISTKPLNKSSPHFRIKVETSGTWIGIGVTDKNYTLDGGSVIGSQKNSINSAYFHQTSSTLKFEGETAITVDTPIQANNNIDVYVDFDAQRILYWNNGIFLGHVTSSEKNLEENKLYACANLSANAKVRFCNHDKPSLSVPTELKPQACIAKESMWSWSSDKKAPAVVLSENDTAASRPKSDGNNPAALGNRALSKQQNRFRVKIHSMGTWVGVGIADDKVQLNGGSTLGNQKDCLNSSYFQQNNSTLNITGDHRFNVSIPIVASDVIDVLVDFQAQKVHYWNNDKYVGGISHTSAVLIENKVWPCVNLSANTTVTFVQNPPNLQVPKEQTQETAKSTTQAAAPVTPPKQEKKAQPAAVNPANNNTAQTESYDIFISHMQRTGGDLAMAIKMILLQEDPSLKIFLDVDDLNNVHNLERNVENSKNIILLVTEGALERPFVQMEIRTGLKHKKNFVLVHDSRSCPFPNPSTLPEDIRPVTEILAVPWIREKAFREVSVKEIMRKLV